MCRMIFINGKTNLSPYITALQRMAQDLTRSHEFNKGNLGTFTHPHGWGIAMLQNGNWRVHTSELPCFADPTINKFKHLQADAVLLHARQATRGVPRLANVHPFTRDGLVFCHNGAIDDHLPISSLQTQGETDSERFFHTILSFTGKTPTKEALKPIFLSLKDFSAANCFLATPETAFVIAHHGEKAKPVYHGMHRAQTQQAVVYSSEPIPQVTQAWKNISASTIVEVALPTQSTTLINHELVH